MCARDFLSESRLRRSTPTFRSSFNLSLTFAYLTGWRNYSEILGMQWHQVDMGEGVVRLNPGTTENREGREFPFGIIDELRDLFEQLRAKTDELERRQRPMGVLP